MRKWAILIGIVISTGCYTVKPLELAHQYRDPTIVSTVESPRSEPTPVFKEQEDNNRFVPAPSLIGLTEEEVKALIGLPKRFELFGCRTNVQTEGRVEVTVVGDQWSYEHSGENTHVEKDLCVFRGKVIAEQKGIRRVNGRAVITEEYKMTDHDLIRELLLEKNKTDKDLLMEEEGEREPEKDL